MKFARHFAAVLVVIAIIAGLGLAWGELSGPSGSADRNYAGTHPVRIGGPFPPASAGPAQRRIRQKAFADGPRLNDLANLVRTAVIELAIGGVVVMVGVSARRRRARRRALAGGEV